MKYFRIIFRYKKIIKNGPPLACAGGGFGCSVYAARRARKDFWIAQRACPTHRKNSRANPMAIAMQISPMSHCRALAAMPCPAKSLRNPANLLLAIRIAFFPSMAWNRLIFWSVQAPSEALMRCSSRDSKLYRTPVHVAEPDMSFAVAPPITRAVMVLQAAYLRRASRVRRTFSGAKAFRTIRNSPATEQIRISTTRMVWEPIHAKKAMRTLPLYTDFTGLPGCTFIIA